MVVVRHSAFTRTTNIAEFADHKAESEHNFIVTKYLSMKDSCRFERDAWASRVFPHGMTCNFSDDGVESLSRHPMSYDVLIIGGNDVSRIGRFLKANRALVSGVVKICLMHGANAQRRAQALMAGFDDVLDSEKMQVEEAVARVSALHRRYGETLKKGLERARGDMLLNQYAEANKLTARERSILTEMISGGRNFISYSAIQRLCSDFHRPVSIGNVKVIICNLRKKLRRGVKIVAEAHRGYRLER